MQRYRLSPHAFLEVFRNDAVLLVADRNIMVTINLAAARLYELAAAAVDHRTFTRSDVLSFLIDHYHLSDSDAAAQLRSLLVFGLRNGVVQKRSSSQLDKGVS